MNSSDHKFQKDLNAGLTSLVVLALLAGSSEDLYGYDIAKRLQRFGPEKGRFRQGSLYPVLRKLAREGLLSSRVVPSYAGPPRRYYRITEQGRTTLGAWQRIWEETRSFIDRCLAEHER